jgi:DNA polymerase III epsilon subunit-like protein
MIGADLLRYNKEQIYICPDVETNGLNLHSSVPFQLSYVKFKLDEVIERKNRYIWWPDLRMSDGAARVTRFDYNSYKAQAEDPKKILDELEADLYNPSIKIVSHNWLGYDCKIINSMRRALKLKVYYDYIYQDYKVYDTLALSKAVKSKLKPDTTSSLNFLAWQKRMLSNRDVSGCSLGATAKDLRLKIDDAKLHDATYDTEINAMIFCEYIKSMELI